MLREISLAEVKRHNSVKSDWIVIHNEVYDVTKYLSEHPGGEDTLLEVAGQVATQSFEDIGHSDDARQIMKNYKIGALPANEHSVHNSEVPKVGDTESWCTAWNREYVVYPAKASSNQCCGPDDEHDPSPRAKPSRNFDGPSSNKKKHPTVAKSTSTPRIERRVNAVVVPRERTHTKPQPRPRPRPQPQPKPESEPEPVPEPELEPEPEPRPRRSSLPPERRHRGPPCNEGGWWKWALLALATAITVGLIVKKKMGT